MFTDPFQRSFQIVVGVAKEWPSKQATINQPDENNRNNISQEE